MIDWESRFLVQPPPILKHLQCVKTKHELVFNIASSPPNKCKEHFIKSLHEGSSWSPGAKIIGVWMWDCEMVCWLEIVRSRCRRRDCGMMPLWEAPLSHFGPQRESTFFEVLAQQACRLLLPSSAIHHPHSPATCHHRQHHINHSKQFLSTQFSISLEIICFSFCI